MTSINVIHDTSMHADQSNSLANLLLEVKEKVVQ